MVLSMISSIVIGSPNIPATIHSLPNLRIKQLYIRMKLPCPVKRDIQKEAKLAKGFMVLVKKKLNRDVLCRSKLFQKLMTLVFHPETSFEDRVVRIKQTQEFQFVSTVFI